MCSASLLDAAAGRVIRLSRRPLVACLLTAAVASATLGCNVGRRDGPTGSGRTITETRAVSGFTAVELRGLGQVAVTLGGAEQLIVEAEDNLLPLISTTVANGTLILELKEGRPTRPILYRVAARELRGLSVSGAGDVDAPGVTADRFRTAQSGSGTIRLDRLTAQELDSSVAGAAALEASGTAARLRFRADGAGKLNGRELATRDADLTIAGAGSVVLRVSDTLKVDISGAGTIEYVGSPRVEQRISGSGTLRQIAAPPGG